MDLLHHVLESLKVIDSSLALFELERPWGFERTPLQSDMMITFTPARERCVLRAAGETIELFPGDTAMVLGGPFVIQSDESALVRPFTDAWLEQRLPALGPRLERKLPDRFRWPPHCREEGRPCDSLLGTAVLVEDIAQSPVLAMLPRLIVLRRAQMGPVDWPLVLRHFVEAELQHPQNGYNIAARQLANLFFIALLRQHVLVAGADRAGWMRGMTDPAIGRALSLMHAGCVEPWNLVSLARACGLSRSNFAQRFHALVGRPPMEYLTSVRMHQAAQRLLTRDTVARVCEAVGYRSPYAFREAFIRHWGQTPSQYTRSHTA